MNLPAITLASLEQSAHPLAIVDTEGRIGGANYAFGKLLGKTRRELLGSEIGKLLRLADEPHDADAFLRMLLAARSPQQCLATGPAGDDLVFSVGVEPFEPQSPGAALISVRSVITRHGQPAGDMDYEIQTDGRSFGILRRLAVLGRTTEGESLPSQRCHELLYHRPEVCDACPALKLDAAHAHVNDVRAIAGAEESYEVRTAEMTAPGHALVSRRRVVGDALTRGLQARLEERARRAALSAREREVLDLLLRGLTLDGIAVALDIERRTVKFHQANLLTKLRVTSRAELLQLLF